MNMIDQKELPEDDIHTINSVKELREPSTAVIQKLLGKKNESIYDGEIS